ncbi:MAG: hypothetical protein COA47_08785 [Robiginitomaculum sp.]|nr:MAG: hypothetical protein COA47_08785 [Robiginitomaculum sp.]
MLNTIGYEKASPQNFLGTLQKANIEILIDIRDRAQSRRPGFSKTALSENLKNGGIAYLHFKSLGDPKDGRDAARSGDFATFRKIYRAVLKTDEAKSAIEEISVLAASKRICLMCYERDFTTCHRKLVSDILETKLGSKVRHLGVQSFEPIFESKRRVCYSSEGAAA